MRKRILLLIVPALLIIGQRWTQNKADLRWLEGSWHDAEHPATRMVWISSESQGCLGLFNDGRKTEVLSIDPDGRLLIRDVGAHLEKNQAARSYALVRRSARSLEYPSFAIQYLSSRSDSDELQMDWNGSQLRLRKD